MPKRINYDPIFNLISEPRLKSFDIFFDNEKKESFELYGVYVWSQSASASLYPLMQQLEILLRNSIDREARKRFGDYWWKDGIAVDHSRENWNNFKNGMIQAEKNIDKAWKKKERSRLSLSPKDPLPSSSIPPIYSHDDIIAATDFGTWKEILINAYSAPDKKSKDKYLWPKSMSNIFKRYDLFSNKPDEARTGILNAINELKDYRNRLFHHDCIWVKSKAVDCKSAIDTIRHKINLIEKLIHCLSPVTLSVLKTWGVINNSRRICSIDELERVYLNMNPTHNFSDEEVNLLKDRLAPAMSGLTTTAIGYGDKTLGVYRLRS